MSYLSTIFNVQSNVSIPFNKKEIKNVSGYRPFLPAHKLSKDIKITLHPRNFLKIVSLTFTHIHPLGERSRDYGAIVYIMKAQLWALINKVNHNTRSEKILHIIDSSGLPPSLLQLGKLAPTKHLVSVQNICTLEFRTSDDWDSFILDDEFFTNLQVAIQRCRHTLQMAKLHFIKIDDASPLEFELNSILIPGTINKIPDCCVTHDDFNRKSLTNSDSTRFVEYMTDNYIIERLYHKHHGLSHQSLNDLFLLMFLPTAEIEHESSLMTMLDLYHIDENCPLDEINIDLLPMITQFLSLHPEDASNYSLYKSSNNRDSFSSKTSSFSKRRNSSDKTIKKQNYHSSAGKNESVNKDFVALSTKKEKQVEQISSTPDESIVTGKKGIVPSAGET